MTIETDEYWLPIPGFRDSYEVSTSGKIRSCNRVNINCNGVRRILRGRILSTSHDGEGYPQVGLFRNGLESKVRVHRLVALVFVKNPHDLPLVDHRNRRRSDNRVVNIRWVSFLTNRHNSAQKTINHGRGAMADIRRLAELSK